MLPPKVGLWGVGRDDDGVGMRGVAAWGPPTRRFALRARIRWDRPPRGFERGTSGEMGFLPSMSGRGCGPRAALALVPGLTLWLACGGERPEDSFTEEAPPTTAMVDKEPTSLVDHAAWALVAVEDDPLAGHRPEIVVCGPDGIILHDTGTFDIYTGECNYYAATQPSRVAIAEGDRVEVGFWHGDLFADDPGFAHVALLLGDTVVWEVAPEIPAASQVALGVWEATFDWPQGAPMTYHVHNHGPNTYVLVDVTRVRGE
ncbi:MAG: hypothetical protein V3V08_10250 [Nannocystaceae bacterium]